MSQKHVDAIVVDNAVVNYTHRQLIVELVGKAQLPAIYPWREPVELGGLTAYAIDHPEVYRYAAHQVERPSSGRPFIFTLPWLATSYFPFAAYVLPQPPLRLVQ
jgi:hypothetical protein